MKKEAVNYLISDSVMVFLKKNNITQTKLAKLMGETLPSLQKKMGREDIGVGYMINVSKALNYDFLCEASYKNKILHFGHADQLRTVDESEKKYHETVVKLMDNQAELLAVRDQLAKLNKAHQTLLAQSPVRPINSNVL